ncbi:MAG: VOC family protein [Candidatus Eremiobacteraeota bacterium]|nr:VOC family protein [Candidatus Eremiobacteraeota bacterium]MBV8355845.1 VOC family protein [Candidatus Eremiobacteraeota bacterium]
MVGASDLQRSIAFYRDKLGLALTSENPNFAFFDAGGTTLALSRAHAQHSPSIIGATEIVFGSDNVVKDYERLRAQGVEFQTEPRDVNGEEWAAAFLDPDGHLLSIFGPP